MCRQLWLPPGDVGRDTTDLMGFLMKLEESCGGHGNGVGWIEPATNRIMIAKSVNMSLGLCVDALVDRPLGAWGIFHTRFVSTGQKDDKGCHPHFYEHRWKIDGKKFSRRVLLTHNGTWTEWWGAVVALQRNFPSDSASIAALIAKHGFRPVAGQVNQTMVAAIRERRAGWKFMAYRDDLPLVVLKNKCIASEGGTGEFEAVASLKKASYHNLTKPTLVELEHEKSVVVYRSGREFWRDEAKAEDAATEGETDSDMLDNVSEEEAERYIKWLERHDARTIDAIDAIDAMKARRRGMSETSVIGSTDCAGAPGTGPISKERIAKAYSTISDGYLLPGPRADRVDPADDVEDEDDDADNAAAVDSDELSSIVGE